MTDHFENGQDAPPERLLPYQREFAGEIVRPMFNRSGKWLAHERDDWMRSVGILDDDEGDDDGDQDPD